MNSQRKKIYLICSNPKNIDHLLKVISVHVKINERSIPKFREIMKNIFRNYVGSLKATPKTNDKLKVLIVQLNKKCIEKFLDLIQKKNLETKTTQRRPVAKERMNREFDMYGDRKVHINKRPNHVSSYTHQPIRQPVPRRQEPEMQDLGPLEAYAEDDPFKDQFGSLCGDEHPGWSQSDRYGRDEHPGWSQPDRYRDYGAGADQYPTGRTRKDEDFEKRLELFKRDREDLMVKERPPTPDFTDDGSGARVKAERERRQMMESNPMPTSMSGIGMQEDEIGMDFYSQLLGGGAPGVATQQPPTEYSSNRMNETDHNMGLDRIIRERNLVDAEVGHKPIPRMNFQQTPGDDIDLAQLMQKIGI